MLFERASRRFANAGLSVALFLALVAGCSGASPAMTDRSESNAARLTASPLEDGLAVAYAIFKGLFTCTTGTLCQDNGLPEQDLDYTIGFGFHPGLSTEKLRAADGTPANGQAVIHFASGTVTATLRAPTDGTLFDLYFVKNTPGRGTVKPESFDLIYKVGTFVPDTALGAHTLSATIGTAPFPELGVNFDLDMVVVTISGRSPVDDVVATGARTMFEKRFFRERAGATLDPVTLRRANFIETSDPLVQAGAELFVKEDFDGNGRKCATCHPLANNQTLDPAFVKSLPSSDPLFHFPSGLENKGLLPHALIRENVDGFEDPTHEFVERGVPHTLSMSTSIGEIGTGVGANNVDGIPNFDGPPPDQRTGWSGDGAPGRGTLNEFAFGAIVQHFTRSLARVPGRDFRIPTQEELDALEAFQRFNGRQKNIDIFPLRFADPAAEAGRSSAFFEGGCIACHEDLLGPDITFANLSLDTGVENLPIPFRTPANMPKDGGFGVVNVFDTASIANGFGNGDFNVPPLFEAADTPPFFHNNAVSTLEDAIAFYQSPQFLASSGATFLTPQLTPASIKNIAGFLRTSNALVNMAQVRRRAAYLESHATGGGTVICKVAIRDTQDAIGDLSAPGLGGAATLGALHELELVKKALENALPTADSTPATHMAHAIEHLALARSDLLLANPNDDF